MKALASLALTCLLLAPAARAEEGESAPAPTFRSNPGRFTLGGALGLGAGSYGWGLSVRGEVGYLATERLWTGVSGRVQWTHDTQYPGDHDSVDYGAGAWGRFFVVDRFFASAEWDWTSYEMRTSPYATGRESFSSFLVGGGFGQPVGGQGVLLLELLYDVTGNLSGVYDTPWVARVSFSSAF